MSAVVDLLELDPATAELKALFELLVKRAGGSDACGVHLGISRQRVEQLYSPKHKDLPTLLLHILPIEAWRGEPVVTAHYARKASGGDPGQPIIEAMEAIEAIVAVGKCIRIDATRKDQLTALLNAKRQLDDVFASLGVASD